MACTLTQQDIDWMIERHPGMQYDRERNALYGVFSFKGQYCSEPVISDHYTIAVLCDYPKGSPLPSIIEMQGRIKRMAVLLGIPTADLHMNSNDTLCIIRPDKFKQWYPNGFNIKVFERNLVTHFYWLSYRERYGKEPWKGEEHGGEFSFY